MAIYSKDVELVKLHGWNKAFMVPMSHVDKEAQRASSGRAGSVARYVNVQGC